MSTIRTLVVDDEKPARDRLLDLLNKEPDIELAGVGRDGQEALTLIRSRQPDLLFLDIQMPLLNGLGVLREIGSEKMPVTIFVTAFDQYAIQAFEAHAIDYLLKPFSDERFEAALQRVRHYLRTQAASELGLRLAHLLDDPLSAVSDTKYLERIAFKFNGRVTFLDVDDLDWVEASGVYVNLYVGSKSFLYRATLGQLQQRLNPKQFVRVHRSALVNTARIVELQSRSHGEYTIILKNGKELTLSRGYRSQLERWLRQSL
jgi:two-component system, LytTR family, response regulator